jgi:hypothetical protein
VAAHGSVFSDREENGAGGVGDAWSCTIPGRLPCPFLPAVPMMLRPDSLLHLLLVLVVVAPFACAQNEEVEMSGDERAARRLERVKEGKEGKEGEEGVDWSHLSPEERLARSVTHGASAHCRFLATCKPEKLLPGQSGVMLVTAVLQGQAVLPSPAPLELMPNTQQGMVTVGGLTVWPAEVGKGVLAKAYQGRPVYDNYVIFEVPVTMASTAQLDLKFDLYDGSSAQPVGRFLDRVSCEIEVGRSLDPAVRGGAPAAAATGTAGAAQPRVATPAVGPKHTSPAVAGAPVQPAAAPPSVVASTGADAASSSPPPLAAAGDDLPLLPIVGGALALLVLGLLVLRRR